MPDPNPEFTAEDAEERRGILDSVSNFHHPFSNFQLRGRLAREAFRLPNFPASRLIFGLGWLNL